MASPTYALLFPDAAHRRLLAFPTRDGWTLPEVVLEEEGGWTLPPLGIMVPRHSDALDTIHEELGLRLTALHQFEVEGRATQSQVHLCTLENHSADWDPPAGGRWLEPQAIGRLFFNRPVYHTAVSSWFAENVAGDGREPLAAWWRPGWWDGAIAWANVRITPRDPCLFDWQEDCVTHPFFSLASFLSDADQFPGSIELAERVRGAYFDEWRDYLAPEASRKLLALLQPLWLLCLAFQDRGQLATWWRQLVAQPLLPLTAAEWSIRQRQRCLTERLRRLLSSEVDNSTPERRNA